MSKLLAGILCVGALTFSGCGKKQEEEAKPAALVTVKTAKVEAHDLMFTVSAPATIFAREQANIAARMTAPIAALRVKKGDTVQAGQSIATLDSRDLQAQRADAAAQLADAEATLQKTQGGTVPADLDQKRGQVQIAQAALNQAQKNAERRTQLFNEGAIPQRDLLQAQTDLAQAQTNFDVSKRALDFAQAQTSGREIRSAQARVESARAKLDLANTQLQFTDVKAPFGGTVAEQMVFAGDMADPMHPLFQLMDLSVVNARAQVPEGSAAEVHRGQTCTFNPSDPSLGTFRGTITVVNSAVDAQRRTVEVWCQIENGNGKLQGNVFGQVTVAVRNIAHALAVPESAVQFHEGTRTGTVMVMDAQGVAHQKEIEAGPTVGGLVQIKSGVEAGETVVTEGGYALPDGTKVQQAKE
jgi:multidrug efflux pump subunit AcrA (membrane-fusion protein)